MSVEDHNPGSGPEYFETRLEVLLAEISAARAAGDDNITRELCVDLARKDMPPEYRMEGLHQLGLFELADKHIDKAFQCFEDAREIAVDLNDYARMALNQRKLGVICDRYYREPARAHSAFELAADYQERAEFGIKPDPRFGRQVLDDIEED
ncbi:hypothetical protein EXS54_02880 [Patescibacteria group bacterium]|nr:hypothetical protein [Patescibacteria group bacterium]